MIRHAFMTKIEFGKWLFKHRNSLKLTQDQLAKSLGLRKKELVAIEQGALAFPKSKVHALAMILKVEKKFVLELKVVFSKDAA